MPRIETQEGADRGRALYQLYPQAITQMAISRKKQWAESAKYRGLKNNCRQMDLYIDNSSPAVSTFISDISPQTIRRGYNEFVALFNKFLETDPLYAPRRCKGMTPEQEHFITETIQDNLEKTYYRERCLQWNIDHIVRYGTAGTYTFAVDDYNANGLMTVRDENYGTSTYSQVYKDGERAAISMPVHPLNVIIDPRTNFQVAPDYLGLIADICIANIAALMDNPVYIKDNIKEVFEGCKKGQQDTLWYDGEQRERRDYSKGHSNITYLWTRLPFEGNEDDSTWYAIEMINDKIIRIEENTLDDNTIPISLMRILPRQFEWFGNSILADKICIQNLQYWLINTTVESTARLMDRIILYREGTLDVEAINSRHQTGGFVPYKGQEQDLQKLVFAPQFPNSAFRENDWLMQLTRREDQDSSAMPNFNPQSEGGPTNKTLGGAQMMASIGELKMAKHVNDFVTGLKDTAKQQLVVLRNLFDDSDPQKALMLGNVNFAVKVSNVFNYIREGVDSQNRLTQLINFKGTQIPEFTAVKMGQYIEDWVRNSVKRENIDDYLDKNKLQALQEQGAAVPQNTQPGGVMPQPGAPLPPVPANMPGEMPVTPETLPQGAM